MNVRQAIAWLVEYAIARDWIAREDERYATNRILEAIEKEELEDEEMSETIEQEVSLEEVLQVLLRDAVRRGIIAGDSMGQRDLLDTKIMGCIVPLPSRVISEFWKRYAVSPKEATDYYYQFCQDSDYIRRYRICKDQKWITDTPYGKLDITINLSKPEKDPRDIAAAKHVKQGGYPKCLLCPENEGYAGRVDHPARQNHRVIPITMNQSDWCMQYSPYVYYNEHCIVFHSQHVPMKIDSSTFVKLLDFVEQFPHYMLGSNADLPIVGGSILTHDHFQGGNYEFPMAKAPITREVVIAGFEDLQIGVVKWPMSVIRISGEDKERVIQCADTVYRHWKEYSDPSVDIYAKTGSEEHNTITPIARRRNQSYEMDLVLRNNRTSSEHPMGIYHPHANLHHIKKENIGLIEVMGLAVLPARLEQEMKVLKEYLLRGEDIRQDAMLEKHADWVDGWIGRLREVSSVDEQVLTEIVQEEIGLVFMQVLTDAGVYKDDLQGQEAFGQFLASIKSSNPCVSFAEDARNEWQK